MAKIKVLVFGIENGHPLKIQLGEDKFQIASGITEIEQDFFDKIKGAYKDNIRLASDKAPVITNAVNPAVEVKVKEVKKEIEKKEPSKRGRPAKKA